ncbi:hypothetical protein HN51_042220 [Arachis hypogaea]
MAAACKRLAQLRMSSGISCFGASKSSSSNSSLRSFSQLLKSDGRRFFLVDTLTLVKKLEAQGVPRKQAEAITDAFTEVLNDSLDNTQESSSSKLKAEVQSSKMQLLHDIGKLRTTMRKNSSESRYKKSEFAVDLEKWWKAAQYDVMKYCIGTFVLTWGIGLTVLQHLESTRLYSYLTQYWSN